MTDPTPSTPVTIQDRIRMALSILSGGTDLETIRAQMYGALMRTTSPLHYPWLSSIDGRIADLETRLDSIQAVLGAAPYDSTETANIKAILLNILLAQGNIGINPDNPGNAIVGTANLTLNGRRYVVWNSNIPGLTRSNNNISLTATNGWGGYWLYVQTEAETCWTGVNTDVPTNSWINAPLTGVVEVSVDANYSVRAYMRYPVTTDIASIFVDGYWRLPIAIYNPPQSYTFSPSPYYAVGDTDNPPFAIYITSGGPVNIGGQLYGGGQYVTNIPIGQWYNPPRLTEFGFYSTSPFTALISYQGSPS